MANNIFIYSAVHYLVWENGSLLIGTIVNFEEGLNDVECIDAF